MSLKDWSTTAGSNTGILSGITLDGSVLNVPLIDDSFREMAAQLAGQVGKVGFKGADIASATTTDLSTATGWYVDVTGTTTITSLGVCDAGQMYILRFASTLTLTHNASTLILPGSASLTTQGGDIAVMMSLGAGAWRCVGYQRISGAALGLPTVSTDNTVPRFNGTAGVIQTSGVTIDDSNNLVAGGTITSGVHIQAGNGVFGSGASTLYLRPNGVANTTNQAQINSSGSLDIAGQFTVGSHINGVGVMAGSFNTMYMRPNGNSNTSGQAVLSTAGVLTVVDLVETSDERNKTGWQDMPQGFLDRLAGLLSGSYIRVDSGMESLGVSAQSLQSLLPQAVVKDDDGMLSVSYGRTAMVACVELAREIRRLRALLEPPE